jgi:hypothetical protein
MNENKLQRLESNGLDVSPNNATASSNPLQFISNQFGNILKKGEDMIHSVRNQNLNHNVDKFQNLYYNGLIFVLILPLIIFLSYQLIAFLFRFTSKRKL